MTNSYTPDGQLQPRLDYVMCCSPAGAHRMAYWEWGDPHNARVLLCVHGLTRTGRDFDRLAQRLAKHYRVVCPDVVGRGKSDWLINAAGYVVPQYVADMLTLIARLNPSQLDWVGTSMGGLIGMGMAGTLAVSALLRPPRGESGLRADQTLVLGKVVLNDIGPKLSFSGLSRIAEYVGEPMNFDTFEHAVNYVRSVSSGFGTHDQKGWEELTRYVFNQQGDQWAKHYDLRIAEPFADQSEEKVQASEAMLWAAYESIASPILVVRGEESDLLTAEVADEMLARNHNARLHKVPHVGHAPTFRSDDQIDPVEAFLLGSQTS
ncbi:alpha/beta fold hydrolase [Candidimonas sp. SYP-B2681]|uniref:alpha/beta fold hydrolase n=1 Tax=Candidimonas sp. SYP-B2681 TaxID=2497686 RepID=UPI001F3E849A|nr:alpha/beta hydrolase [Candidimonas sp. SYP-B2681]